MKAIVNDRCGGSGSCVQMCPEVFELGEEGMARVKVEPVPKETEASCRQAERECPYQAIEIEE